jgi:hypothetical protein
MYSLPGPKFFRFAHRLPAYKGVMRLRLEQEEEKREMQTGGVRVGEDTYREVPADNARSDMVLNEFIEFGGA